MYMIAYSTYLYYFAACGINQLSYVGMNAIEIAFTNRRACGFDVKYQMYVDFAQRLCHIYYAFALNRASILWQFVTQGDALGYALVGLSARALSAVSAKAKTPVN